MNEISQNEIADLMVCESCGGRGTAHHTECAHCKGMARGRFAHGIFLYWQWPIDAYWIRFRRIQKKLNTFIHVVGFSFGVLIAGLFIWYAIGSSFSEQQYGSIFSSLFWTRPSPIFFWLYISFGVDLLVLGHVMRHRSVHGAVNVVAFGTAEPKELSITHEWSAIRRLHSKEKQNIATAVSQDVKHALESAFELAEKRGEPEVTPAHLTGAMLDNKKIQEVLIRLQISPREVALKLAAIFGQSVVGTTPVVSEQVWRLVFEAYEIARAHRSPRIEISDLFSSLWKRTPAVQEIIFDFGVQASAFINVIQWIRIREYLMRQRGVLAIGSRGRGKGDTNRAMTAVATPFLNQLCRDLTRASLFGAFEPLIGRETELEAIFRVSQGGGQSVLLVGEHGVGRRTIVTGIADLMVAEQVPLILQDKRLVELDVPRLLAGADPSLAEERLLMIIDEARRAGNIILFIPELEKMIGITAGREQSLDVAGVLASELQKGGLYTIAITTHEAYRTAIANKSIGTVFQKIEIDEMDDATAIGALEAKAGFIEYKNNVWFTYATLERAVSLSRRYLRDTFLPANAIELIQEAALAVSKKKGKDAFVTAEDIGEIVAEKTKIPVTAVTEDESKKLLRLESVMHGRVVGQDEAVALVANALRRARAEVRTGKRPIANFLFLGPTGVGKTELAKTIAEVYFGSESQMIRLDMSEFQDTASINRLIGRPGEQGTGILTEAVRQKPFALLLLDELEKAESNILNLFLQVMDDGRLTDSVGRVIDFTNTIIIATSNAGTQYVQDQMRLGATSGQIKNQLIHGKLQEYFRPEFMNRFDAIVLFQPLTQLQIVEITRHMLSALGKKLEERGIALRVSDAAVASLAAAGFDPEFGARPLRRVLQDKVENAIAGLLLENRVRRKDTIVIDENGVTVESGVI